MKIFCIKDKEGEIFLTPFFARSVVDAIRAIANVKDDAKHNFVRYYPSYSLYELGEFNEENGEIDSKNHHEVCAMSAILKMEEPKNV